MNDSLLPFWSCAVAKCGCIKAAQTTASAENMISCFIVCLHYLLEILVFQLAYSFCSTPQSYTSVNYGIQKEFGRRTTHVAPRRPSYLKPIMAVAAGICRVLSNVKLVGAPLVKFAWPIARSRIPRTLPEAFARNIPRLK